MKPSRPPRVPSRLLSLVLRGEEGRAFHGDLDERFRAKAMKDGLGSARRWYWSQAFGIPLWAFGAEMQEIARHLRPGLAGDLRRGLRTLRRSPLYSVGVAGTVALGIAAATVSFAVAWRVWLEPMPWPTPERVVRLYELAPAGPDAVDPEDRRHRFSPGLLNDFRDRGWRTIQHVSAVNRDGRIAWVRNGEARILSYATLSPEGFGILGMAPTLGRPPVEETDVFLGEAFWRRQFGADSAVVGSMMQMGDGPARIVGVGPLPAGLPGRKDVLFGAQYGDGDRSFRIVEVIARLRPGFGPADAKQEADAFMAALAEVDPTHRGWSVEVVSLAEDLVRPFRDVIALLYAAGLAFLLLATVNVAGLVAARGVDARRERSIRLALGASETRLMQGSLVQGLVLAMVGAGAGIAAAYGLMGPLRSWMPDLPRLERVTLSSGLVAGGLFTGLAIGALIGLAGYLASRPPNPPMKGMAVRRAFGGGRGALVVGQIALVSLILSAGAAIAKRAATLHAVDLGFDPAGIAVTPLAIEDGDRWGVVQGILRGLEARGIEAAAALNEPLNDENVPQMSMRPDGSDEVFYEMHLASADYFRLMGIEVVAGRVFEDRQSTSSRPEVVVSEAFATRYFPAGTSVAEAVGREIAPLPYETVRPVVVGVVASTRHRGPEAPVPAEIYVPLAHLTLGAVTILALGEPSEVAAVLREVAAEVDPDLRMGTPTPYASLLSEWYGPLRVQLLTVSLLAGLGLLLASLGLYSFMAYRVVSGRREIGIRKAVGAPDARVVGDVVGNALLMAVIGGSVGLLAWSRLRPWAGQMVDGIDEAGFLAPLVVTIVIASICVLATLGPALRASRVDPAVTLKADG